MLSIQQRNEDSSKRTKPLLLLFTAKSPLFSLLNSSLLGLETIRSCQAQNIISKEFDAQQDDHTAAHHLVLMTSSAFGFWLDLITTSFLVFVAYSFIFLNDSNTFAGDVGLALTQILKICGMLQFTMRQLAETVAQMTSVERMFQFTELDQEGPFESAAPGPMPEKSWPSMGEIKFQNLYLRYSVKDGPILKNLNLTIKPSMKVKMKLYIIFTFSKYIIQTKFSPTGLNKRTLRTQDRIILIANALNCNLYESERKSGRFYNQGRKYHK